MLKVGLWWIFMYYVQHQVKFSHFIKMEVSLFDRDGYTECKLFYTTFYN